MDKKNESFAGLIPEKNIKWEVGDDQRVYLLKEKSKNRLMKKLINIFDKSQYFRIHLDDTGTYVWGQIDGSNSVKELGRILRARDGNSDFLQSEERVEKFILMLMKNKFVKLVEEKKGPV